YLLLSHRLHSSSSFLFEPPPPTSTTPLSLPDALPILPEPVAGTVRQPIATQGLPKDTPAMRRPVEGRQPAACAWRSRERSFGATNRKSTRLNSSHVKISYAVFCLKKKK